MIIKDMASGQQAKIKFTKLPSNFNRKYILNISSGSLMGRLIQNNHCFPDKIYIVP